MRRIAVVGGGLSGLAAAYQLARDGLAEFTLFEASARLGGIVETVQRDGFVVECGPDSWVSEKPWARELAIELGLEAELLSSQDAQRKTYLFEKGKLTPLPDGMRLMVPTQWEPVMASSLFSAEARQAYLREPERAEELKQAAPDSDESVASFVRRHFGDEVARTVAGPLLAGVFGGDVKRLSVRAVMPAFVKMEREYGSLILALQAHADKEPASIFTTLHSGLGTLIDRVVAMLPAEALRVSHAVTALRRTAEGWLVEVGGVEQSFDAVIVATPAHETRQLLRPVHEGFETLLAMEATSAIVVAMAFSSEQARSLKIPPGFGYLVPQKAADSQLLACTFVHQKFSHRAPEEAVLLRGFWGGMAAASLLDVDDDSLMALTQRELSDALGPLPAPLFAIVRRWPLSLPQYAVGHLERMAALETLVSKFSGLKLVGNAYYGVGLPDMVRMGREAAHSMRTPR